MCTGVLARGCESRERFCLGRVIFFQELKSRKKRVTKHETTKMPLGGDQAPEFTAETTHRKIISPRIMKAIGSCSFLTRRILRPFGLQRL